MTDTAPTRDSPAAPDDARQAGDSSPSQSPDGPETAGEPFLLSRSPTHLLRRAQQFAADTFSRAGIESSVTARQALVLAAIAETEGASQTDLVNATGVDRSTLAEMIARMERKGLVTRAPARDDLRAKTVRLTSAGRQKLAASLPRMRAADETLLAALPKARRAAFADMLVLLADAGVAAAEAELAQTRAAKAAAKARKSAEKADRAKRKLRKKRRRKH